MENCNASVACIALKINHDLIVQDIQGDVIQALLDQQVLTEIEFNKIKSMKNREKEACLLLELLPLKGKSGINQFINYLSLFYSWIADSLLSTIENEHNGSLTAKIHHALTTGEVPQLSSRHVSRTDHVITLKQLLIQLQAGHFVVVNGMNGCGKTSLVVEVLNDPLILMQYFQGFVQWINVGREHSLDVGRIQTEILNRLNDQEQLISPPLDTNDIDYETTRKTLQNLWKNKKLTNGLLVLDDVCCNQIVKYLDIGCKILITTHDTCIMEEIVDTRVTYFRVNEGFEENETLSLFSKCLKVKYSSLPPDASKLHKLCKGFPLIISLIGAQLETHREDTINSSGRWKYYLKTVSNNASEAFKYSQRSDKLLVRLENAIKMCIKSLPNGLQKKYHDFALFVHDLNIKSEVLSVLWDLNKTNVEDIMLDLISKNLAVRVWNQPLNSYVYSVHDLLLNYLKKLMNRQQLKKLHKKLIKRYKIICNGNFAELPKNDNYIFLYFGYHLKNADMLEEFPRWFLNLKFLESKICVTGPADLLADLKKYRKYIAVQSIYEEYIKEIEHFVKCIGPSLYQTKCDIVQFGLQEPPTSFIYSESYKIAKMNGKSYFYYDIWPSQNFLPKPYITIIRDKIECAIFGNEHDEIIFGTENGSIKVWNVLTHKCLYTYNGHIAKVTHLVKNKLKDKFLSTSADSTIRIWNLNNFPDSDGSEARTPSPESRQEHWQNPFDKNYKKSINITDCLFVLKDDSETVSGVPDVAEVTFAQFSSNDNLIVSLSNKILKVWKLSENGSFKLIRTMYQSSPIHRCYFMEHTKNDDRIIFSIRTRNGGVIYGSQWPFDHCTGLTYLKEELLSFFLLPGIGKDKLLILTPTTVYCYQFEWDNSLSSVDLPQPKGYQYFTLSAVSEINTNLLNNTRYIAFSLNNCTIQIYDLSSGYNFLELNDPVHGVLSLDWFWSHKDQCNWLLCAAEDKTIRLWCLNDIAQYTCADKINTIQQSSSNFENKCKNEVLTFQDYKLFSEKQNLYCYKLKQNFDAVCLENEAILVAAVTQCESLKIIVENLDQWSVIDKKVSAIKILHSNRLVDQTVIIVAFNDLSVHMLKHNTSEYLFDPVGEVNQIFGCFEYGKVTVAIIRNNFSKADKIFYQTLEVWTNSSQIIKHFVIPIPINNFTNCYVSHDKVIVIHNTYELVKVDVQAGVSVNLKIDVIRGNGSLVLNDTNIAVSDCANSISFFELTDDHKIKYLAGYSLPFKDGELTPISLSNNKNVIVIGGDKCIVLIHKISGAIKQYTIDSNMRNIQSMLWSSNDTCLAIKTDNQIIVIDIKSGKKIASVRFTANNFTANSTLTKYIAVNTAGQLVVLSLSSIIDS